LAARGEGNEDNTDTNVLSSIDRTTTTGMKARDTQNRTRVSFAHEMDALDKGFADSLHWQLYTQHSETTQITDEDRANRSRRHRAFSFDQRVYGLQAQFNKAFSTGSVEHALTYAPNNVEIYIDLGRTALDLRQPDVAEILRKSGMSPVGNSPEAFGQFVVEEIDRFRKVARDSGMRVE